jgi:hypothetical protein
MLLAHGFLARVFEVFGRHHVVVAHHHVGELGRPEQVRRDETAGNESAL